MEYNNKYLGIKSKMEAFKDIKIHGLEVSKLNELIGKAEKNVMYSIVTKKSITPYTFLLDAIKKYDVIDELYIATYRITAKAINNIEYLLDNNKIKKFTLVINDNYKVLMKDKSILIEKLRKRANVIIINSHVKITLIRCKNHYIAISGSGNFSTNPKVEQYTLMENEKLYNFHKNWMEAYRK